MKTIKITLLLISLTLVYTAKAQNLLLAENGKTNYTMVLSNPDAMQRIAGIFSNYFEQCTGSVINISKSKNPKNPAVFLSLTEGTAKSEAKIFHDGFTIRTSGQNLFLTANNLKGLENAVHHFFEIYAGVSCYAKDFLQIPKKNILEINPVSLTENPDFSFRTANNVNAMYEPYRSFHKLNNATYEERNKRFRFSQEWGLSVHTFDHLLSPEVYFKSHPEYFAQRNGIRTSEQLCLSNPDVLKIVIESLKKYMAQEPAARYWSVSQMDNYSYCCCDQCRAVDSIEGSPSGSLIRFVNQVAEAFPDKVISTLAYQYSRKPPVITKPAPNVNIMLCTIECDRSKPIENDTSAGSFASDIKGWAKISQNIMVWDYVVNFSHSLLPFPNYRVLQPNLRFFKDHNVTMMFEQGFTTPNTDMTDLRGYLLAKLMWKVNYNTDSLMIEFCNAYYGKAGPFIVEYLNYLTEKLDGSGKQLTLYEPASMHSKGYLSPENLTVCFFILQGALTAVEGDSLLTLRVENVIQSVRYAYLEVCQMMPHTAFWIFRQNSDGKYEIKPEINKMLKKLVFHANQHGPDIFCEMGCQPDVYYKEKMEYFEKGVSASAGKIKAITYNIPYSNKYPANDELTLYDGVFGTLSYFSLWHGWWGQDMSVTLELNTAETLSEVKLNCLENSQSWIISPKEAFVSVSMDGKNFKLVGYYENPEAGLSKEKRIIPYRIKLSEKTQAKYVRVLCRNYGKMPAWTGVVNGDTWIFTDEIEIF